MCMCLVLLLVIISLFSRCGKNREIVIDTVAMPVNNAVNEIHIAEKYYNRKVQLKTKLYYRANDCRLAWLGKRRTEKIFDAFVGEVKTSEHYGFKPGDYHIDSLEKEVVRLYDNRKRTEADIASLDMRITASFFLFTTHLLEGRIRYPGAKEFLWKRGTPLENDIALLLKTESVSDLNAELEKLQPKDPQYAKLQRALQDYRALIKADTFPPVPRSLTIKPDESHEAIKLVRKKLALTDSGGNADTSTHYDAQLQKILRQFQERHGLTPDGVIGGETIRFLNQTMEQKAALVALNLERTRWRPHLKGKGDEIVINVPEYMLTVYNNGNEKLKMRVVLGAEYTPTPVFHDTLKYIVFSPTWMVPQSIFKKEFLPQLQTDPGHFDPQRFTFYKDGKEIDPYLEPWNEEPLDTAAYRVVENPNEINSLGKVKFIMPNDFSIYLHDTPAGRLFSREERALSHGCIRLEQPAELALFLLADKKGWNKKKIAEAMEGGKPVHVDLDEPFPVYIIYRTTWVDNQGFVQFRSDIYGHDARQLARLQTASSI